MQVNRSRSIRKPPMRQQQLHIHCSDLFLAVDDDPGMLLPTSPSNLPPPFFKVVKPVSLV
jgi:hypothetical protein